MKQLDMAKSVEDEIYPPYYMALGLTNYGGRIVSTEETGIDQLTGLHIGLLLVACVGAIILLFINCVGLLCCTRYFIRNQEPDTLLDASFGTTDSGRRKWTLYKTHSEPSRSCNVDIFPQSSFEEGSQCEEHIKLQTFPIKDHGAISKTAVTSDQAICKNCNIWL